MITNIWICFISWKKFEIHDVWSDKILSWREILLQNMNCEMQQFRKIRKLLCIEGYCIQLQSKCLQSGRIKYDLNKTAWFKTIFLIMVLMWHLWFNHRIILVSQCRPALSLLRVVLWSNVLSQNLMHSHINTVPQ